MSPTRLSRRGFNKFAGAVVATFSLAPFCGFAQTPATLPVSLRVNRRLDGWIRIDEEGEVTVFTGKAELGQGIMTALLQVAAEELDVDLTRMNIISADTSRSPNEGYTYGSQSIEQSGAAIQAAAAQARSVLLLEAASRLSVSASELRTANGVVWVSDGRSIAYGKLVEGKRSLLDADVSISAVRKHPSEYKLIGKAVKRIDFPAKFVGGASFVQDMRMPHMLFGRVARPPRPGAKLLALNEAIVRKMPGVVAVVRDGDFLGVVAERTFRRLPLARHVR
jgi:nicotinate dehydrogenase subunit B